ncbi:MAG: hypothetical protein Q9162_006601 [Coniocarpon cinnabarinum]
MPIPSPSGRSRSAALFETLEFHPYSTDYEYQAGLAAILGHPPIASSSSPKAIPADSSSRDLHLRARCFYFARKFPELCGQGSVDFDEYVAWREQQSPDCVTPLVLTNPSPPLGSANVSANHTPEKRADEAMATAHINGTPLRSDRPRDLKQFEDGNGPDSPVNGSAASFQEVMEMIKEGKPIPGIKDVPDTVLEGQGTASTSVQRKKPWEATRFDDVDVDLSGQAEHESTLHDVLLQRR